MHELGIASNIIEGVQAEVEKRGAIHASRVSIRVGELSAVDPDALRFAFESLVRDTPFFDLVLDIQICPLTYRCRNCAHSFCPQGWTSDCPSCGAPNAECVGGDELDLAYLEMEDESSGTGAQSPQ